MHIFCALHIDFYCGLLFIFRKSNSFELNHFELLGYCIEVIIKYDIYDRFIILTFVCLCIKKVIAQIIENIVPIRAY